MRKRSLLLSLVAVGGGRRSRGSGGGQRQHHLPPGGANVRWTCGHRLRERLLALDRAVHHGLYRVCLIIEPCGGQPESRNRFVPSARDAWPDNREPRAGVHGLRGGSGRRGAHPDDPHG